MKNQPPTFPRKKKSPIIEALSSANTLESRPFLKSIRDLNQMSPDEMSLRASHAEDYDKTEDLPLGRKSPAVRLQEITSQSIDTPESWRSLKSNHEKTEVKGPTPNQYGKLILDKKQKPAENDDKASTVLDPPPKLNSEIKPIFTGLFKGKPNPKIVKDNEATEKLETKVKEVNSEMKKNTCIMTSKIDIDMVFYDIKYFFTNGVSSIEIQLSNPQSTYKHELPVPSNKSVFDFITKDIEPCLILQDDQISFDKSKSQTLVSGMLIGEKSSGHIQLTRFYPRWKIEVKINEKSQIFEMADIKHHFPNTVDFTKDHNSLIALFTSDSKGIQINMVMSWPLEKIYENSIENDYLRTSLDILINRVSYLNSYSYLVQVKDSIIKPLLIENQVICKRTDRIKPTLNETINFLIKNITIDSNNQLILISKEEIEKNMDQLANKKRFSIYTMGKKGDTKKEFNKSAMFSNLQGLHEGINKVRSDLIRPQPSTTPELLQSLTLNKETESNQYMMKSILAENIDLEDRIILRTCLSRNNTLYQICMSLSKGETLNFYIRKGSEAENLNKFSILVSLLCEKTGLRKDLLIPLGSYVLRNMLIIKDSDICYFDFSRPAVNPGHAVDKIASLFKALYTRKRVSLKLKNLAGKRKIKLDGLVYTCLVYIGNEVLYVRLVRGAEVFSLDVSMVKVVKDGYFVSIDKFFKSLVSLGLRIVERNGKKGLDGLEKYRLN